MAALALPFAVSAEMGSWRALGPYGGYVECSAVDPDQPNTLYVGVSGVGVFKSTDAAAHWERTSLHGQVYPQVIAVSGADSDRVYVATLDGLRRSADGGHTFAANSQGLVSSYLTALALHPSDPDTLFVGSISGVARSGDGGASFADSSGELSGKQVGALVFHPTTPAVMYAAVYSEGVYKSTNGGANWVLASSGLGDLTVRDLILDPTRPERLYAATDQGGVFRTTDGAAHWSAAGAGNPQYAYRLGIDPAQPDTVFAGAQGSGIYRSTDAGQTWSRYVDGLPGASVSSLSMSPDGDLYLGIFARGLFKRSAGSASWVAASENLTGHQISSLMLVPEAGLLYAAANSYSERIFKSATGGSDWTISASGMSYPIVHALIGDPTDPDVLYSGNSGWLYKSTNAGASWFPSAVGMPESGYFGVYSLAMDPADPNTIYAGTDQGVYKTTNAAGQWSRVGLSGTAVSALVVDGGPAGRVYAGTSRSGVYRSENGGTTWTPQNVGLPATATVSAMIVDPIFPDSLWVGIENGGVYASIDRAEHWSPLGLAGEAVDALLMLPTSPPHLVAGTRRGVFRSENGGASWNDISADLPDPIEIAALSYDERDQRLYAGGDRGVFALSLGDPRLDSDGDQIPDDGNGSGTAGDAPCVGGEVGNCDDNCPGVPNAAQADADGDGIGDACECGDASGDGHVNSVDARLIQRCVVGLFTCPPLCDVTGEGDCNSIDARMVQGFAVGRLSKAALVCGERRVP